MKWNDVRLILPELNEIVLLYIRDRTTNKLSLHVGSMIQSSCDTNNYGCAWWSINEIDENGNSISNSGRIDCEKIGERVKMWQKIKKPKNGYIRKRGW